MTAEPLRCVELVRVALPLRRAHHAAHGREAVRDLILVRVELADGTEGWGECSTLAAPTYTAEHTEGAWAVLRDLLVPAALEGRPSGVVGHPMAAAGLSTAVADAQLRRDGRALVDELATIGVREPDAPGPAAALPVCAVVSRTDGPDGLVADVADRLEGRVAMVKLKLTPSEEDLAAAAVVRATWPDLALAVDFNGTADLAALRRLAPLELAYVEQPAPADELVRSAHLAASVDVPIALDESVTSPGTLDAAVALGAGRIVNVKPARCGGVREAAALVARAKVAGMKVFVGGMVESGVGRAAALAVAAQPGCTLPTDLGPSLAYVDVDVTEPLRTDDLGRIEVPDGPGIGRTPIPEHLASVTVDRLELS
ncbi:MAG: enolase C-terminal domain-like protein [Acidimicrobiales bacterium]